MNIEITLTTDDGKPMIMDGCSTTMTIFDHEEDAKLVFNGQIIGNKVIFYYELPEDKK